MPLHTLVLLYPGCVAYEVMLAAELMSRVFPLRVVTPDGLDHQGSNGITIRAHMCPASADPSQTAAVLIPGGDPGSVLGNTEIDDFLRAADRHGVLIGAICAGPLLVAKAGLLRPDAGPPPRPA